MATSSSLEQQRKELRYNILVKVGVMLRQLADSLQSLLERENIQVQKMRAIPKYNEPSFKLVLFTSLLVLPCSAGDMVPMSSGCQNGCYTGSIVFDSIWDPAIPGCNWDNLRRKCVKEKHSHAYGMQVYTECSIKRTVRCQPCDPDDYSKEHNCSASVMRVHHCIGVLLQGQSKWKALLKATSSYQATGVIGRHQGSISSSSSTVQTGSSWMYLAVVVFFTMFVVSNLSVVEEVGHFSMTVFLFDKLFGWRKQVDRKQSQNVLKVPEALSQIETEQAEPQTKLQEAVPQIKTKEAVPQIKTKEAVPQIKTQEAVPHIETQEAVPHIETQEAVLQIKLQEVVPHDQIEAQEAVPQIKLQEAGFHDQIETQEGVPQIETQEAAPQIDAQKAVLQINLQEAAPQIKLQEAGSHDQIEAQEAVPQIEAQEAVPQIEAQEAVPQIEAQEAVPQIEAQEAVPQIEAQEAVPQIEAQEAAPQIEAQEAVPQIEAQEAVPQIEAQEAVPQIEAQEAAPQIEAQEAVPQIEAQEAVPQIEAQEAVPQIEAQEAVPQIEAQEAIPHDEIEAQEAVPQIEAQEAAPQIEAQEAVPQIEAQEAVPQIEAQEAVPQIEAQEAVPQIEAQEAIPHDEIEAQEAVSQMDLQEAVPQIETQEVGPQIKLQEAEPEIETQEAEPQIELQEEVPQIKTQEAVSQIELQEMVPQIKLQEAVSQRKLQEAKPQIESQEAVLLRAEGQTAVRRLAEHWKEIISYLTTNIGHQRRMLKTKSAFEWDLDTCTPYPTVCLDLKTGQVDIVKIAAECCCLSQDDMPEDGAQQLGEEAANASGDKRIRLLTVYPAAATKRIATQQRLSATLPNLQHQLLGWRIGGSGGLSNRMTSRNLQDFTGPAKRVSVIFETDKCTELQFDSVLEIEALNQLFENERKCVKSLSAQMIISRHASVPAINSEQALDREAADLDSESQNMLTGIMDKEDTGLDTDLENRLTDYSITRNRTGNLDRGNMSFESEPEDLKIEDLVGTKIILFTELEDIHVAARDFDFEDCDLEIHTDDMIACGSDRENRKSETEFENMKADFDGGDLDCDIEGEVESTVTEDLFDREKSNLETESEYLKADNLDGEDGSSETDSEDVAEMNSDTESIESDIELESMKTEDLDKEAKVLGTKIEKNKIILKEFPVVEMVEVKQDEKKEKHLEGRDEEDIVSTSTPWFLPRLGTLVNWDEQVWTLPSQDLTVALVTQPEANHMPLQDIFTRIGQKKVPGPRISMRYEILRLCTLRSFPTEGKPFLTRLSAAGFYYASKDDELICYVCGIKRHGWSATDVPLLVHKRISPTCNFLLNNEEVNVPIAALQEDPVHADRMRRLDRITRSAENAGVTGMARSSGQLVVTANSQLPALTENARRQVEARSAVAAEARARARDAAAPAANNRRDNVTSGSEDLGIEYARPKHPQYAVKSVRVQSFEGWPESLVQRPSEMAQAGFYYAGFGDCVRCFFCGIGLRHWAEEDSPWIEHGRWSSKCAYLRQMKGEEFIQLIQMAVSYTQEPGNASTGDRPGTLIGGTETTAEQMRGAAERPLPAYEDSNKILLTDAAQSVLEMGYQPKIIKQAIETILRTEGPSAISSGNIMEKVLDIEDQEQAVESSTTGVNASHSRSDRGTGTAAPAPGRNEGAESQSTTKGKDSKSIKAENERLKEQTKCKVCLVNTVCIVFLPCGHLVTCEECAPAMRQCPICRASVKGTVKTYMA